MADFVKEAHELEGVKLINDLNIIEAIFHHIQLQTLIKLGKKKKKKLLERRNLLDAPEPAEAGATDNAICCCVWLAAGTTARWFSYRGSSWELHGIELYSGQSRRKG